MASRRTFFSERTIFLLFNEIFTPSILERLIDSDFESATQLICRRNDRKNPINRNTSFGHENSIIDVIVLGRAPTHIAQYFYIQINRCFVVLHHSMLTLK